MKVRLKNGAVIKLLIACICLIAIITLFHPSNNSISLKDEHQLDPIRTRSDIRKILYYHPLYGAKDIGLGAGFEPFIRHNCSVNNCWTTNNRNALDSIADFDAVIFHIFAMNHFYMEIPKQSERRPSQRYVMYQQETPIYDHDFAYSNVDGFFNWTMTYRLDSDIPQPYGWVEPKDAPFTYATDIVNYQWKTIAKENIQEKYRKIIRKKTGTVAWIVSHCHTFASKLREDYVDELRKYIDVDTMGKCGSVGCNASIHNVDDYKLKTNADNCTVRVDESYKFYLSLENSLCTDYVTEKFFLRLALNTVPIVFGKADYARIAPPHSYISTDDFESPKELADYLHWLNENDEAYAEYFWWKEFYTVREELHSMGKALCHLCSKLNDPNEPEKIYRDMDHWWRGIGDCRGQHPWYRRIANTRWYKKLNGLFQKTVEV